MAQTGCVRQFFIKFNNVGFFGELSRVRFLHCRLFVLDSLLFYLKLFEIMTKEFESNGHRYKVTPVENSTDSIIIRDGTKTRRVKREIADRAIEFVDKLF